MNSADVCRIAESNDTDMALTFLLHLQKELAILFNHLGNNKAQDPIWKQFIEAHELFLQAGLIIDPLYSFIPPIELHA